MNAIRERVNALSNERQELWLKAGRAELTREEYWRLHQIPKELEKMCDTLRCQRAAGARRKSRRSRTPVPST